MDHEKECHALAAVIARIHASATPAYVKDSELRYITANTAYASLLGKAVDDLVGLRDEPASGLMLIEEKDEAERRAVVFGREQSAEIVFGPGGRSYPLRFRRTRIDGGPTFLTVSDDPQVLEAHLASDVASDADAPVGDHAIYDWQELIETMPMGVVLLDASNRVRLLNSAFFDIWKLVRREQLLGQPFRRLIDINRDNNIYDVADDQWEYYVATRIAEMEAGPVAPREFARADGRMLIYSVHWLPCGRKMVTYFDVTEMHESRRQLVAVNDQLARTLSMIDDAASVMAQGLMIHDGRDILLTNAKFHELLGVDEDIAGPGRPCRDLIDHCAKRGDFGSPEETARAVARLNEILEQPEYHSMERAGAYGHWLRIDVKPTDSGMTVVTYTEIGEIKAREQELARLVVQAEASDRAKSEFLANMSHEIRTPMNGVLGMAELLAKTELDARQRTYADIIMKSGTALLTIINDILDFSKIEAGQLALDSASFSIRDVVDDVAGLVASGAKEKNLELIVRIGADMPHGVMGDVGRFRQIVTNIVGNAIKFTEHGHILISVDSEFVAPSDDDAEPMTDIVLSVSDTGMGIPAEKLDTIFEKFSQVDGSSTRRHEGTGLGLAITVNLVKLMGGDLRAESAEGQGSTFTVRLRMPIDTSKPVDAMRHDPDGLRGLRILVVDDNPVNRDILTTQLAARGCDSCGAASAMEGLAVLKAARAAGITVDCVVLDHHMPEMTGMEMAARLRTDPTFATLPIVLLTSMDVDPNRPDFKALKFNSWLTKPARESLLIDTLLRVLRRAPTSAMERAVSPSVDEIAPPASSGAEIVVFEDAGRNRVAQANALLQPSDETFSLELWMDSEGLAESVACIGAALSASEESEAGSGDAAHIDRQIERYAQTAGKPAGQGDRLDILVAEDNEVNQIVFSQILDEMDVVYRIVSNGALALEALASADPRLILMDVSMPVMNGHQATRAIRQREVGTGQRVPIVGVTAHALKGDREACIEAGMDDYLSKPISPEKLEAKVREWLSHGDGASSARQQ